MEVSQAILGRRSVRKYKEDAIPHEIIEQIIEHASYSPSWKHSQIARYIYIEDKDVISKIADDMILDFDFNKKALNSCAGVMAITYITNRSGFERDGSFSTPKGDGFEMFDAGIACQTLCLSAYDKGIATVITGYFDEDKITKLLGMPENQKIGTLVCMGYADETPAAPKRKAVADLLSFI